MTERNNNRLESLDILRGLDMFFLTVLGPAVIMVFGYSDTGILGQFEHKVWEGFSMWDIIMPLFMFMSGATIAFSMSKYVRGDAPKSKALARIGRRVVCLWILGMAAQGHLLTFDFAKFNFFSNTLQSIAVGYAVSALLFLFCRNWKIQVSFGVLLLLIYWALMVFVGKGYYTPENNLCLRVDKAVLGAHRVPGSTYTWILSSITFIVTVLMGMLSGELLKGSSSRKSIILVGVGAACAALGWIWGIEHPVIKHIWTSSMTLVSGGYSMILLGFFHWLIDEKGLCRKALGWLKLFGMNALLAYMIKQLSPQFGLNQWLSIAIMIAVLLLCWKKKWFLRV